MFTTIVLGSEKTVKQFRETETRRAGYVVGHKNESKVISELVQYSQREKLGLKIFPEVEITPEKMVTLLAAVESPEKFGEEKNMEIDVVAIGKSAIYLVETKSSIRSMFVSIFIQNLTNGVMNFQ